MFDTESEVTRIGSSMVIHGEVASRAPVVLEGTITGSFSGTVIHIEASGYLSGIVNTERIDCDGRLDGRISTRILKLTATAEQLGVAETEQLEIEQGARINCIEPRKIPDSHADIRAENREPGAGIEADYAIADYLHCFTEEQRPCCYDIPRSGRRRVYGRVLDLLSKNKPLLAVTGEKGAGKSVLLTKLLENLPGNWLLLRLDEPIGSVAKILQLVALALKVEHVDDLHSRQELFEAVRKSISEQRRAGKKVVLLIDNAEQMYQATMEAILALLSGATTRGSSGSGGEERLQIVLFGTEEMTANIVTAGRKYFEREPDCQLLLEPLTLVETALYLRYGLHRVAGVKQRATQTPLLAILPDETIRKIHLLSRGDLQAINHLAEKGLKAAIQRGEKTVSPEILNLR